MMVYKKSRFLWQVTNLRGGEWNSSEDGEVLWWRSRRITEEKETFLSHLPAPLVECELRKITARGTELGMILRRTAAENFFFTTYVCLDNKFVPKRNENRATRTIHLPEIVHPPPTVRILHAVWEI